jgi:hypothetical protein
MNDALDDAVDRLPPVLDVAQEIDRRTHLVFDEVARLLRGVGLAEHLLVAVREAQARAAVVGEINLVLVVDLFDENFRARSRPALPRILAAGVRVERADEGEFLESVSTETPICLERLCSLCCCKSASGCSRMSCAASRPARAPGFELDEQAFAHVARAAADGVETEHDLPRLFDRLLRPAAELCEFFVGRVQTPVRVEVADDGLGDGQHALVTWLMLNCHIRCSESDSGRVKNCSKVGPSSLYSNSCVL